MPSWYPEGNLPTAHDTECVSLQKITSLLNIWANNQGVSASIPWYQAGSLPTAHDTECISLQKINALLLAISRS